MTSFSGLEWGNENYHLAQERYRIAEEYKGWEPRIKELLQLLQEVPFLVTGIKRNNDVVSVEEPRGFRLLECLGSTELLVTPPSDAGIPIERLVFYGTNLGVRPNDNIVALIPRFDKHMVVHPYSGRIIICTDREWKATERAIEIRMPGDVSRSIDYPYYQKQ